jgi:hypothetical protein
MDPKDQYLTEVAGFLTLPEELKAEILEELAAHLADTVADLENTGLEPDLAEAEALARLGQPDHLARALATAHRTPAQLLAAAGAGTWAAIGSGVGGAIVGWLVVMLAAILGTIVVRQVTAALDIYFTGWTGGWNTVLTGLVLAAGALAAGTAAVHAVARRGWRAPYEVRDVVALTGGTALALLVLVLFEASLNWASVLALSLVPIAFAVGTRVSTLRPTGIRTLGVLSIATAAVVLVAGLMTGVSAGPSQSYSWNQDSIGSGILPPWWGGSSERANALFGSQSSSSTALGGETIEYQASSQQAIAQLRDFRLEAWVAQAPRDDWRLVPGQTRPFAVAPAYFDGTTISGTIAYNQSPTVTWAQVVLTAVGHDGQRYLLDASGPQQTEFFGSVWSWFAALLVR